MIRVFPYTLHFSFEAGTSRGVLRKKTSWFIHYEGPEGNYYGECGLLKGLSLDDRPNYEEKLLQSVDAYTAGQYQSQDYLDWPSLRMGWEMIDLQKRNGKAFQFFDSAFTQGQAIPINGLVWMGNKQLMKARIRAKLEEGFRCIKLKIGAIHFEDELTLLGEIRKEFNAKEVELRVDANGAFPPSEALDKLNRLAELQIHSIEQPIAAGQWQEMARICEESPIAVALDEELIPLNTSQRKRALLDTVQAHYLILKPSLLGGFAASEEWISLGLERKIHWWATSALESNLGLMAIAQWCSSMENPLPQGLGTGGLYTNNIPSPLQVMNGYILQSPDVNWDLSPLDHA